MVTLVSNNEGAAKITKFSAAQVGLTPEENGFILEQTPKEQFVMASGSYDLSVPQDLQIDQSEYPSLKKYMRGPFAMKIYNRGDNLAASFLCFDIEPIAHAPEQKTEGGILLEDNNGLVVRSLAIIPFCEVFHDQIEQEAEQAQRLIRKSKQAFQHAAATRDRETVDMLMRGFYGRLHKDKAQNDKRAVGKEAIADTLASSLTASSLFYEQLWGSIVRSFDPALRHLGEECALGTITLDNTL